MAKIEISTVHHTDARWSSPGEIAGPGREDSGHGKRPLTQRTALIPGTDNQGQIFNPKDEPYPKKQVDDPHGITITTATGTEAIKWQRQDSTSGPVKKKPKKPQFDQLYPEYSALPEWIKLVISDDKAIACQQLRQLKRVNPELDSGKLVSLKGVNSLQDIHDVSFNGGVIEDCDLYGVSFRRCDLRGVTFQNCRLDTTDFTNCKMVGCDLGNCDLNNTIWLFNQSDQQLNDIDCVSQALENCYVTSRKPGTLVRLFDLLIGRVSRTPQVMLLLQKYGCDLSDHRFHYIVTQLSKSASEHPVDQSTLWQLKKLRELKATVAFMEQYPQFTDADQFITLKSGHSDHIENDIKRVSDALERCYIASHDDWLLITLINLLIDDPKRVPQVVQLLQNHGHGIRAGYFKSYIARLTEYPDVDSGTIGALLLSYGEPMGDEALCSYTSGLLNNADLTARPKIDLQLLMDLVERRGLTMKVTRYLDLINDGKLSAPVVDLLHKRGLTMPTEFLEQQLFEQCSDLRNLLKSNNYEQGLEQFKDDPVKCSLIVKHWLHQPQTEQHPQLLSLVYRYRGADRAWDQFEAAKARLQRCASGNTPYGRDEKLRQRTLSGLYAQAYQLWPTDRWLYIEHIACIDRELLSVDEHGQQVGGEQLKRRILHRGLQQSQGDSAQQKEILECWLKHFDGMGLPEALLLVHEFFGRDAAKCQFETMKRRLPRPGGGLAKEDQQRAWDRFYQQAIELWPEQSERLLQDRRAAEPQWQDTDKTDSGPVQRWPEPDTKIPKWQRNPDGRLQSLTDENRVEQSFDLRYPDYAAVPGWIKVLVTGTNNGAEQLRQLEQTNPALKSGELTCIEGIKLNDIPIRDCDLSCVRFIGCDLRGVSWQNCRLESTSFTDCKVAGCDFSQCDLSKTCWYFSEPESYGNDIKCLSLALQRCYLANSDPRLLRELLDLPFVDIGRAFLLLQEYAQHLEPYVYSLYQSKLDQYLMVPTAPMECRYAQGLKEAIEKIKESEQFVDPATVLYVLARYGHHLDDKTLSAYADRLLPDPRVAMYPRIALELFIDLLQSRGLTIPDLPGWKQPREPSGFSLSVQDVHHTQKLQKLLGLEEEPPQIWSQLARFEPLTVPQACHIVSKQSAKQLIKEQLPAYSNMPESIQCVITAAGMEQFQKLLARNPILEYGELYSLRGIEFNNVTFRDCDFHGLSFRDSQLVDVHFVNCKVDGCYFSGCNLGRTHWHFSVPEQYARDIAWVSQQLKRALATNGDIDVLKRLLDLHVGSNNTPELIVLLKKYGHLLTDLDYEAYREQLNSAARLNPWEIWSLVVIRLLKKRVATGMDGPQTFDSPHELIGLLERYGDDLTDHELTAYVKKLAQDPRVSRHMLIQLFDRQKPWLGPELGALAMDIGRSELTDSTNIGHILQWLKQCGEKLEEQEFCVTVDRLIDHFHITSEELMARLKHQRVSAQVIFRVCQRGLERTGDTHDQQSLAELWSEKYATSRLLPDLLPLIYQHLGPDQAWGWFARIKQRLQERVPPGVSWNGTKLYSQGITLWPEREQLFIDYLTDITAHKWCTKEGYQILNHEELAWHVCQRGMERYPQAPEQRARLFRHWLSLSPGWKQRLEALPLVRDYLSDEQAWQLFEQMKGELQQAQVPRCTSRVDLYSLALTLWPNSLHLYTEFITLIKAHNLLRIEGYALIDSETFAFEICQQGLEQFKDDPVQCRQILGHWLEQADVTQHPEFLLLVHKHLGESEARRWFAITKENLPLFIGEESSRQKLWINLYAQAHKLWSGEMWLYIEQIQSIEEQLLSVNEQGERVGRGQLKWQVLQRGLQQFQEHPEQLRPLIACWCQGSDEMWQSDALSLINKYFGREEAISQFNSCKQRLPQPGDYWSEQYRQRAWNDFYQGAMELWPDQIPWLRRDREESLKSGLFTGTTNPRATATDTPMES